MFIAALWPYITRKTGLMTARLPLRTWMIMLAQSSKSAKTLVITRSEVR